ncbi:heterokaryon incompatibility protein-domain-containing protein [Xylaria castorea]|nr:heterokaryon incompatibility protein-domain-containing protein [Xylaria castorea]
MDVSPITASAGKEEGTPQYRYQRLSSLSKFRVLELFPGVDDEPVSYRLHTADWKAPPAYEAVSYAWGDVSHKHPAICDGFQHMISLNLRDGLIAMRLRDCSRMLWVDFICIDQRNTEERGQQVSIMRSIYEGASRVLVWLGPDTESRGKQAIAAMREITRECLKRGVNNKGVDEASLKSVDELWDVLPTERLEGPRSDNPETWKSLAWIFSRPWFSRLWVIQEVNSNKDVQLLCGSCHVSWDVAVVAASYIRRHASIYRHWGFPESNYPNAYYMRRRFWLQQVSLPSLLNWGRSFKASESLDRVYALMGMPSFTKMRVPWTADYSRPKRILYEDVATKCIQNMQDLRVLTYSQHSQEGKNFPSWVPQWDREALYEPINDSLTKVHWKASGNKGLSKDTEIAAGVLRITGVVFDVVESMCPLGDAMWAHRQTDHPVLQFWERQRREPRAYPTGETNLEAFSFVMTAGLGHDLRKASENRKLFNANFAAYLSHLLRSSAYNPTTYRSVTAAGKGGNWSHYDDLVRRKCRNRALLLTKRGYLGLGPACQVGDHVCILRGGEVPFILRPINGHFRLVGDAYIHGIMEGEGMISPKTFKQEQFEIY